MPSLKDYRQLAAEQAGSFYEATADPSGNSVSRLVCSSWPIKSNLPQDDLWKDHYLYLPAAASADQLRVVSLYTPLAGYLDPDSSWSAAPNGLTFELHGIAPANAWHKLINAALKRCFVVVEISATPTANVTRHSLTSIASWLLDPRWVYQAGWLASGESRNEVDPFERGIRGEVIKDGTTVIFDHPHRAFDATDTLYFKCLKPAYYHCRPSGGTWGSQSGLSLETDEAEPTAEWVAAATLVELWDRFGKVLSQHTDRQVKINRAEAADQFSEETDKNLRVPARTILPPVRSFGPRW